MPALIVEPIRKRLADLCGSLVLSAVVVLVTTIVMFLVRGESATPEQFAWLSLVSIAGAWGVLVPAKFWEGTRGEPALRRFTMLVVGLLVGAAAWGVQKSLFVSLPHEFTAQPAFSKVALAIGTAGSYGPHSLMAFLTYFGFLFLLVRWWRLADPLRGSRLSLWATAVCVSCAIGLYLFWPFAQKWEYFPQPWGFLVAANIAIAVQLASPWVGRRRLSAALPLLLTSPPRPHLSGPNGPPASRA
ncbi:MAG: hypothetical protein K8T25_07580 [Planctomycetia bacterium]|nr:hypothetical protein [Planctomycetia bacterium]